MSDLTCAVDGHETPGPLRRDMCNKHYRAWWRANRKPLLDPDRNPRRCSRPGCSKPHFAKGLCHVDYSSNWYHSNIDRARAQQATYRDARRPENRQRVRVWRDANPGRASAMCRRYYASHRAEALAYRRSYRQRNRTAVRLLNARRRARLRNAPVNDLTGRQWHGIKVAYGNRCAYCRERRPLTIDHVQPLAKGGAHTAANVVPACQSCNSRKGDRAAPTYQPLLM